MTPTKARAKEIAGILAQLETNEIAARFRIGDLILAEIGKKKADDIKVIKHSCNAIQEEIERQGGHFRSYTFYYDCLRMARTITGKDRENVQGNPYMTLSYAQFIGRLSPEHAADVLGRITKHSPTRFGVPRPVQRAIGLHTGENDEDRLNQMSIACPFDAEDVENVTAWIYSQARRGGFITQGELDAAIEDGKRKVKWA